MRRYLKTLMPAVALSLFRLDASVLALLGMLKVLMGLPVLSEPVHSELRVHANQRAQHDLYA